VAHHSLGRRVSKSVFPFVSLLAFSLYGRGNLAFVENGNDSDELASLVIRDGVALNPETAIARLQMVNRKSDFWMQAQRLQA